ncbi:MAG: DUF748 domain-containing protein [Candidatus Omnitrophica bacterium]|nr:DUF748 domain-containing protein [Candidatus Omnitrophota bacterium]
MQKKFRVLFLIVAIFLAIFVAVSILVGLYAPKIVEDQIRQNLKVKASLGKISLSLPFTIVLEKLEIGNLANIKKISFSPNLIALLFGKVVIHGLTITEPVINLEQSVDGKLNLPVLEQNGTKAPEVYPTSLKVQDAKIIFTDRKVNTAGYQVIVDKLNISVAKVSLPVTSLATDFSVSCQLANSAGEAFGDIIFSGWLDYLAKNMDAKLEVKDLNITNFSPYYGNFISNKKLLSAKLNLGTTFKAKNNALNIATDFNLSHLVYEEGEEQGLSLDLAKNALDLFTDADGNLHLVFNIDTKLDNPALSQDKLKSIILKAAMKNLSSQSPEQLVNKVSGVLEKFKGYSKELKEIFGK